MDYLTEFKNYLTNIKKYSENTVNNYEKDIKKYIIFLKNKQINLSSTNYDTVKLYLTYLYDNKLSRNTVSRTLSSLRTFYNYLKKNNIIEKNIFSLVNNPKKERSLPKFINNYELDKMFEVFDLRSELGQRNRLILEILYATGIRVSELINIKINDIDKYNMSIKIKGKGNKERYVFYGSYCEDILNMYLSDGYLKLKNNKDNNYLILNKFGNKISSVSIRNILNDTINKCALDIKISPHVLRHTFATHMLSEGANLMNVKEWLGHSTLSTTSIYTHITDEKLKETYYKCHPRA